MKYNGEQIAVESAIVEILQQQLADFVQTKNIFIQDQNRFIPNSKDVFVAVRMVDAQQIGNVNRTELRVADFVEIQEAVFRENVQIDIFSKSTIPVFQRSRVMMALNSLFASEVQSRYNFKIYRNSSSFVNSSGQEGGSQYNRFTMVVPTHVWYRHEITDPEPGCYDKFPARVDDQETIGEPEGIIEFEIKEE